MKRFALAALPLLVLTALPASRASAADGATAVANVKPAGAAATQPALGNATGTVTFTQAGDSVKVTVDLTGLPPGKHGFHIHEKADLSGADLKTAGPHFDPDHTKHHGGPGADAHHAGDMGNIEADKDGKAQQEFTITGVSVGGKNDVIGHAIIIHANEDDMKTQDPTNPGGSGKRIAGGVIEAKK
jgi:Cu-Zn family superoxide dismutase